MKNISIEERAVKLAHYIIESKDTVRGAAKRYGISKSTVHSEKPGGSIAYCTSKAGVDMLTKFMAQELTKYKIRVNSINPAFVESNIYLNSGDYSKT